MRRITICISGRNEKSTADAVAASVARVLQEVGYEDVQIGIEGLDGGQRVAGFYRNRKGKQE